jgi:HEAT repeat protein
MGRPVGEGGVDVEKRASVEAICIPWWWRPVNWAQTVIEAFKEMPPWWGVAASVGVTVSTTLCLLLPRVRAWQDSAKHLKPFSVETVLRRGDLTGPSGLSLAQRIMRSPSPRWSDWADQVDGLRTSEGYIVAHPGLDALREAVTGRRRGPDEGASAVVVVGSPNSGKSTMALTVARERVASRRGRAFAYRVGLADLGNGSDGLRQRLADICALAKWDLRRRGVLLIVEDAHLDWAAARRAISELQADPRLRRMGLVVTARDLPEDYADSRVRTWYDDLPKVRTGGQAEHRQLASDIARRMCSLSQQAKTGLALQWDRVEPHLDEWLRQTGSGLFEWVLLLSTVREVNGDYVADRALRLKWVLQDLGVLATDVYPALQRLYEGHGVHPATAVTAAALLQAPHDVPVSQRFLAASLGVPEPLLEALVVSGALLRLHVSGESFLRLPHVGKADLVSEAVQRFPEEARRMGFEALRDGVAGHMQAGSDEPAEVMWHRYLDWVGQRHDVAAFSTLCERTFLVTQRTGMPLKPVRGIPYHWRLQVRVGADPARSASVGLPSGGRIQPLIQVTFATRQELRRGGHDVRTAFGPVAASGDIAGLCRSVLSDVHSNAAAGALHIAWHFRSADVAREARRAIAESDNPRVRMTCAHVLGATRYYVAGPQLREALADDPSRSVRAVTAWALSRLPANSDNTDALLAAFDDEDDWVACEAIWAVADLSPLRAAPLLAVKQAVYGLNTDQGNAAWFAMEQMTRHHTPEQCRASLQADQSRTRFGALWCLAYGGDTDAQLALAEMTSDEDSTVRAGAFSVFGQRDRNLDAGRILDGLRDTGELVRALAAGAAGSHKTAAALPTLQDLLGDPDALVVRNVVAALRAMPEASSVKLLEGLFGDTRKAPSGRAIGELAREAAEHISKRTR